MIKLTPVAAGLILSLAIVPAARAQVKVDVSKITCEQLRSHRITRPDNIAIWLNGYNHGKRGETTLDTQTLISNARKLQSYCGRNPHELVMQAVETLFGTRR